MKRPWTFAKKTTVEDVEWRIPQEYGGGGEAGEEAPSQGVTLHLTTGAQTGGPQRVTVVKHVQGERSISSISSVIHTVWCCCME